jgi:ferritin-like metal-binding protein YciE
MEHMNSSQQKVVQYLSEARESENALVRTLQSQIAMTPRGSYRSALGKHLDETQGHAQQVADRLHALDGGASPIAAVVGFWEDLIGQALALSKTPLELLRGSGGEEKVLKNAKDACAAEALEIATYTAIERLARAVGDDDTADLARRILADEERMLQRVMREIPTLTDAVVQAEVKGQPSYDIAATGAGEAVKQAGAATTRAAGTTSAAAKRTARQARKVPGVARVEGQVKGAVAGADDLAIARYDSLTADEITAKLPALSQIDLATIDSYERKHENRTTILSRISTLRANEPWPGYDELTAPEVQAVLAEGDDERVKEVLSYERAHKDRAGVRQAAEREVTNA